MAKPVAIHRAAPLTERQLRIIHIYGDILLGNLEGMNVDGTVDMETIFHHLNPNQKYTRKDEVEMEKDMDYLTNTTEEYVMDDGTIQELLIIPAEKKKKMEVI